MTDDRLLREHLARALAWEDAHTSFDTAVSELEPRHRGSQPASLPYSPWQLVEHLRLAQFDILDFCRNSKYRELHWPDDYWPSSIAPPSEAAWADSVGRFTDDRQALRELALDPDIRLDAKIPHGNGQTYLRELLLAADHSAYHVGQLVVVRRLLGAWPPKGT
ncbi:MAG TPA: DinB family protein [Gemmatimonadales bacterium]|jgi:hypothetical protein